MTTIDVSEALRPVDIGDGRSLVDIFRHTADVHGDRTAIDAADMVLNYRELAAVVDRLAARLRTRGYGPGDRIGVRVTSGTADLYVAILGILTAGAAYVPVDMGDPIERADGVWRSAGACAVVGDDLEIVSLSAGNGESRDLSPDDTAWIIFTSGSTGEPKGVAVSHRSAAAFVDAETELWTVTETDRVLAGLSVGFDASCEEMWLAWRNGAALVPAPRSVVRAGVDLGTWLSERSITVVSTVPTLASMLDDKALATVRLLILGGEVCSSELGWRLAKGREVWNTYGPTEATVVSTAGRIRPGEPITIGQPLNGWTVAVVDQNGEPVSVGEPGELVIGGVGLGRYLDAALDSERYAPSARLGWDRAYRSGDFVRETPMGYEFVGRQDDQVKLGGRRIELGEIDATLAAAPGVRAAAAAVQSTAGGDKVLVGYVAGETDLAKLRTTLIGRLPEGVVPLIVQLDSLPIKTSGKVDRPALPWPPPPGSMGESGDEGALTGTAAWLAELWADQLGPLPMSLSSNFFELGGSSLQAAKLVSVLRSCYPAAAVADVYDHRELGKLAERLDSLSQVVTEVVDKPIQRSRFWGSVQVGGVVLLFSHAALLSLVGIFIINDIFGVRYGPQLALGWLIPIWLIFDSTFGRAVFVLLIKNALLGKKRLKPGRYPRRGWLSARVWFVEHLADVARLGGLAGTPWAPRYARLLGYDIGENARLGTLPPPTSLVRIGAGATVEGEVDMHGWWLEGDDLVIGSIDIGAGARVGTRTMLMPGASIGEGAEIEPGSLIDSHVPAGERWSGSPARFDGVAGEGWPEEKFPSGPLPLFWKGMFAVGLVVQTLLPLVASIPGLLLVFLVGGGSLGMPRAGLVTLGLIGAPVLAGGFFLTYAVIVALTVRFLSRWIQPGLFPDEGKRGFAMWMSENLMGSARTVLFPLYSSIYTRPWLRLAGMNIGKRCEVSTVVGLNHLSSLETMSFAADDVVIAASRSRNGWIEISGISLGKRSFLGNGALLKTNTVVCDDSLVGVLTVAPQVGVPGTSWFGSPAMEMPRMPDKVDATRTTNPPRKLIVARGAMELIRIMLPGTISVMLGTLSFAAIEGAGVTFGIAGLVIAAPLVLIAGAIAATLITIATKWLLIGRYRAGEHPLWSFFVWRDEILNTMQEQLAGTWLLDFAMGTPIMGVYLRAMGAKIGHDVWVDTLTITEFDIVDLGDGCAINRQSCVETHLFHDRLMRIGPITFGDGVTLGPASAVLPDAIVGAGCTIGGRSVVMRGEELPPATRWHGSPVVCV